MGEWVGWLAGWLIEGGGTGVGCVSVCALDLCGIWERGIAGHGMAWRIYPASLVSVSFNVIAISCVELELHRLCYRSNTTVLSTYCVSSSLGI